MSPILPDKCPRSFRSAPRIETPRSIALSEKILRLGTRMVTENHHFVFQLSTEPGALTERFNLHFDYSRSRTGHCVFFKWSFSSNEAEEFCDPALNLVTRYYDSSSHALKKKTGIDNIWLGTVSVNKVYSAWLMLLKVCACVNTDLNNKVRSWRDVEYF